MFFQLVFPIGICFAFGLPSIKRSSKFSTCLGLFRRWAEMAPNHRWLQPAFTRSSMSTVLGILKRPRCIPMCNHYLSQAKYSLQATLHMIFVSQTADCYTHIEGRCLPGYFLANIFIPWFPESFIQLPPSSKISKRRKSSYLGKLFSTLAGCVKTSLVTDAIAWLQSFSTSLWNLYRSVGALHSPETQTASISKNV